VLAYHFLNKYRFSGPIEVDSFSNDALMVMQEYKWPGNVRELQAAVERMVAEAQHPQIRLQDLPDYMRQGPTKVFLPAPDVDMPFKEAKAKIISEFEKQYIEQKLKKYHGNISKMAAAIGLNRKTIYRLIEENHISYDKAQNPEK